MKKILLFAMGLVVLIYVGCKKKTIETTPLGTATVTGHVFANLDLTNDTNSSGNWEYGTTPDPVAGMRVFAVVNYYYLDQTPNGGTNDYKTKTFETLTDANGQYTLSLPAGEKNYTVTIQFQSFEADQKLSNEFGDYIGVAEYTYSVSNTTANVYAGAKVTQLRVLLNENANAVNAPNATGTYTLSGIIDVDNIILQKDTNVSGLDSTTYEFMPAGTEITVRVSSYVSGGNFYEYFTFQVGANGQYTVNIPTHEGPLGISSYTLYFPEVTMNFQDDKAVPQINESRIFEVQFYTGGYTSTATNGQTDTDINFRYILK